jgi:hypothetical protein
MFNKLSEDIAQCYRHADVCAQRAKSEHDAALRDDWTLIEHHWLSLARSYELTERIERLSQLAAKRVA